ncbi:hypothetical protein [Fictibacillus sp. 18YEL24]|uniref:hypothetical protein n=1 Tax=Fictibacillus sp. 18YEL24 TaxID=2745875 RepID=UPI0018CC9AF7|nr:hypothetical protein [Fictibacillus sp. 18YEL24]MBH0171444.1 hypothetical protein [Fictibacillus sp. 18YEL24]
MNYLIKKVGWCLICDQGWVEIYKDKNIKKLFVCCDECESRWEHPNEIGNVDITTSIFDSQIEISQPTMEEIIKEGWDKYIFNS